MITIFIISGILIIWAFIAVLNTIFNLNLVRLFFLPDIVNGFFWLIAILFQIFGLFFSKSGLAFVFTLIIVFGIISQMLGCKF